MPGDKRPPYQPAIGLGGRIAIAIVVLGFVIVALAPLAPMLTGG
jgi:hypothetical protein